ncbi:MAG: methyltransferase domain-containing protein [Candidatus Taylorbacteria bacterium]|nr:methyltransferase domain-containing protein [Candidatus Taylorbacteria bacterium]
MNDPFVNIKLTSDLLNLYVPRRAVLNFIKNKIHLMNGILLDIGCGTMPYRQIIKSYGKVTKYIGLDLSVSPIASRDTSVADMHWDGISIPLSDCSIDTILATEFLEHYDDTNAIAKEMYRILKPGGIIVFTVPFIWPLHETPNDEHRFTPYALEKVFNRAGFKKVELSPTGGWHASFAQMLGLWVLSSHMSDKKRLFLRKVSVPVIRYLLKHDEIPDSFSDNSMMPGIGGVIYK